MPSVALTVCPDHVRLAACFQQPPSQTPAPSAHGAIWHRREERGLWNQMHPGLNPDQPQTSGKSWNLTKLQLPRG